jgi:hypothetical protein
VHNHLRTHGSEGATEPGRDGLGPVGPSRPAWPTPGFGSPPFPCTRRIFNPKVLEVLSYGPPWAHYLGGYQDRLLGGPLGLPGLRYTAPEGVEHKDYTGVVLG